MPSAIAVFQTYILAPVFLTFCHISQYSLYFCISRPFCSGVALTRTSLHRLIDFYLMVMFEFVSDILHAHTLSCIIVIIIIIKAICNAQDPLKKAANALSGSEKM